MYLQHIFIKIIQNIIIIIIYYYIKTLIFLLYYIKSRYKYFLLLDYKLHTHDNAVLLHALKLFQAVLFEWFRED